MALVSDTDWQIPLIQAKEQEFQDQLNSLDATQAGILQGMKTTILDPQGQRSFLIPKSGLMDQDNFPLFMCWYLENQVGTTMLPVFYINRTPGFVELYLI